MHDLPPLLKKLFRIFHDKKRSVYEFLTANGKYFPDYNVVFIDKELMSNPLFIKVLEGFNKSVQDLINENSPLVNPDKLALNIVHIDVPICRMDKKNTLASRKHIMTENNFNLNYKTVNVEYHNAIDELKHVLSNPDYKLVSVQNFSRTKRYFYTEIGGCHTEHGISKLIVLHESDKFKFQKNDFIAPRKFVSKIYTIDKQKYVLNENTNLGFNYLCTNKNGQIFVGDFREKSIQKQEKIEAEIQRQISNCADELENRI